MSEARKLAAILVADVVGYSRLAGVDEDRTLALRLSEKAESGRSAINYSGIATVIRRKLQPRRRGGDLVYQFPAYGPLKVRQLADSEDECARASNHAAPIV
jgi:hypothetical protein